MFVTVSIKKMDVIVGALVTFQKHRSSMAFEDLLSRDFDFMMLKMIWFDNASMKIWTSTLSMLNYVTSIIDEFITTK